MVPNAITYAALTSSCAKGKQPEQAAEVFEAVQRQRMVPKAITYTALISTCNTSVQA